MPRNHRRRPGARRYADYTEESLQKCLEAIRKGEISQRSAAEKFNIPRRTIQYKLKGMHMLKPGHPKTFSIEEEKNFVDCVLAMSDYGFPVDTVELRFIIKSYLNRCGRTVTKFKNNLPSREWALGFLKRHPELTIRFASGARNKKRKRVDLVPGKSLSMASSNETSSVTDVAFSLSSPTTNEPVTAEEKTGDEVSEGNYAIPSTSANAITKKRKNHQSRIEQSISLHCENEDNITYANSSDDSNLSNELEEFEKEVQFEKFLSSGDDKGISFQQLRKDVGQHVVFLYEGETFPGRIESLEGAGAIISAMVKSGNNWKWPLKEDKLFYSWDDVIGSIEEPKLISKRGIFEIKELKNLWSI